MSGTRHDGILLLNYRINYYGGHPPPVEEDPREFIHARHAAKARKWHVVRHQPKQKTWAASTHAHGTVQHLVKYQLVATHRITKVVVKITVWQCSARCYSEVQTEGIDNKKRCWNCLKFTNA